MRKWLSTMVIAALGLAAAGGVLAQSTPSEPAPSEGVSRFLMGTRLGYITCSNQYRAYLEKWDLYALVNEGQATPKATPPSDEEASACVHETLLKGRGLYSDAVKHAATPAARSALREYMTTWEGALQGIRQPKRESPRDYRVRQREVESRLDATQARLERGR